LPRKGIVSRQHGCDTVPPAAPPAFPHVHPHPRIGLQVADISHAHPVLGDDPDHLAVAAVPDGHLAHSAGAAPGRLEQRDAERVDAEPVEAADERVDHPALQRRDEARLDAWCAPGERDIREQEPGLDERAGQAGPRGRVEREDTPHQGEAREGDQREAVRSSRHTVV